MGCDLVQGYYLAPPMTRFSFEQWLAAGGRPGRSVTDLTGSDHSDRSRAVS
jgi:hypothetical protein